MTEGDLLVRTPGDRLDLRAASFWRATVIDSGLCPLVTDCMPDNAGPMELWLSPMLTTFTAAD